jgi:hypothetical protein
VNLCPACYFIWEMMGLLCVARSVCLARHASGGGGNVECIVVGVNECEEE